MENDSPRVTKYYTTSKNKEERDYDYPVDDFNGDDDSDEKKSVDDESDEINRDEDTDSDSISLVFEEKIVSETQRLKLKYFGDRSLEMAIPTPVPLMYRGLSGEDAVEAEEDFYYTWRLHVFVLTCKERWACLRTLAEDRVRGSYAGKGILRLGPLYLYQLCGGGSYKRGGDGSGGGELRAKGSGSRRWEYNSIVRGMLDSSADSHPDTEGQNSPVESVFKMGRSSVEEVSTSGVKSTMERKDSLLDEVVMEETELEQALGELSLSRKKRVKSKSKMVVKAQFTRSMTGVDEGTRQTSREEVRAKTHGSSSSTQPNLTMSKITQKFLKRQIKKPLPASGTTEVEERARLTILQGKEDTSQMVARLVKGIWQGIEEQESELKKAKSELEKNLARAKTDALKEVKQLKAAHAVAIGQLQIEAKANLDETAKEGDKLGRHLMLKGYSQDKVDAIKASIYAEEKEEEAEVLGVVDGLDGISPQMVLDNQGDDVEFPEGGNEKVVREMSLRINDPESGLVRERVTFKALLSMQAELQVELEASRVCEDHTFMYNREFVEQFDRMKVANENKKDQYVKMHFRLEKLNQVIANLTRQVEEKDSGIKKGLEDLSEAT
ncbi:hypothetical protein GIB67_015840 [Kingdonia uniflora]|uniref:Uncharacterized protein n=1 Tax=Kingdonia uniflora TaxID=39325 RepID=A0A7J7NED7_9MAGN|nr:hypothetical protein GIB67_015840 [Kingdonia uniflora]